MTRSNRTLNRVFVALSGLLLLAAGAWVLAPRAAVAAGQRLTLPDYPQPDRDALWIAAGSLVALAALALAWVLTRGRGRTSRVLVVDAADGDLTIEATVASDVIANALGSDPDVLAVGASAFRVRGSTMLLVRVTARRGADVNGLIRRCASAVATLDRLLETRIPTLLHVASGVRAAVAHEQRVR